MRAVPGPIRTNASAARPRPYRFARTTEALASSNHLSIAASTLLSSPELPRDNRSLERLFVGGDETLAIDRLAGLVDEIVDGDADRDANRGADHLAAHGLDDGADRRALQRGPGARGKRRGKTRATFGQSYALQYR